MKLAIVHDYLNQYGGAEKVVEAMHKIFPEAPVFTSIYLPNEISSNFRNIDVRVSFMQKLPFLKEHFKKYVLLYPHAVETFDLSGYDVVLSSSSAFAKGAIVGKNTCHICYCYTPMRFVWDYERYIEKENFGIISRYMLPFVIKKLKKWDLSTVKRVHHFVAISTHIRQKINRYYGREAEVIYPPVDTSFFRITDKVDDYYLVVSRLNAYKRIDLVVEAFNKLNLPLRVAGDGPCSETLRKSAKPNIKFLGKISDDDLIENYSHSLAVIFPGEEDFGIVPVETQACGRPVIAYAAGGALETIIDGVSGVFFKEQTVDSIIQAIKKFIILKSSFDSQRIRKNALRFDRKIFEKQIKVFIEDKFREFMGMRE